MKLCNFPLDGRKNERGSCAREAGHEGRCGLEYEHICPECDMLLPIFSPPGRCDRCEFEARLDEDLQSNQKMVDKAVASMNARYRVEGYKGSTKAHVEGRAKNQTVISDPVTSPPHYNMGKIECIDAIKEMLGTGFEAYCRGQVLKYLWRAEYKGNTKEDLRKAQWYMNMLVGEDPRE